MPATKDILRHVVTEVAGKQRKCYRKPKEHMISKGAICLVVRDGVQDRSTYCTECAADILKKAQVRLTELVGAMSTD